MNYKKTKVLGSCCVILGLAVGLFIGPMKNNKIVIAEEKEVLKDIVNNINDEELNEKTIEYIKETKDIRQLFNVVDKLSTETIDEIAKEYIISTEDYGMYYSLKPYLSNEMEKELSNLLEEKLGSIAISKNTNIKEYENNEEKIKEMQEVIKDKDNLSKEELEIKMTEYIKETKDIGQLFNVVDKLSTETIDEIAKEYIISAEDYGMYYSLKPYLSKEMEKELKSLAEQNIK